MTRLAAIRQVFRAPVFSARGFLVRAVFLVVLFLVLDALGLRACAGVVCGSHATLAGSVDAAVIGAVAYILSYLGVVLLAPVLVIASGVFWLLARTGPLRSTIKH